MKIYRLYYIEQEYVPSDVYDEDGYCDDYYDNWIDHDVTLGYFANKQTINKWIDEHEDDCGNVVVANEKLCYDEDLQFEEIEVIE